MSRGRSTGSVSLETGVFQGSGRTCWPLCGGLEIGGHIFTIFRAKIEIYVFEMHVKYASTWFAHQLTKCDAYL